MATEETLRIHINPQNRSVSTAAPEYLEAWTAALEKRRAEIETELRNKVESGELEIPVVNHVPGTVLKPGEAMQTTAEDALRFRAHSLAEGDMQNWAIMRGIGMVGVAGGWDHGRAVEYVDDPEVPFLGFKFEEAA